MKLDKTLLDKLKELDDHTGFDSATDSYIGRNFELEWIENGLYSLDTVATNTETGLKDFTFEGIFTEEEALNFLKAYL